MTTKNLKSSIYFKKLEKQIGNLPRIFTELFDYLSKLETRTSRDLEPAKNREGKPRPVEPPKYEYFKNSIDIEQFDSDKTKTIVKELLDYAVSLEKEVLS